MGKLLFWVLVFIIAMIVWRLWNIRQWRARRRDEAPSAAQKTGREEPMVRCVRCGVFLPREEARMTHDGYRCNDEACRRNG
ncbi:MAG: hypothetical protein LBB65_01045 [Burkholderiales bacterium]|jgi:hypothetical protein|nr:hypothetical protein [Burkholderiales bacterium]